MKELGLILLIAVCSTYGRETHSRYLKDVHPELLSILKPEFLDQWDPEEPLPQAWPCPEEVDIEPCLCHYDGVNSIDLDCSAVQDDNEIDRVFKANFVFDTLREFRIVHEEGTEDNIGVIHHEMFREMKFQIVTIQETGLYLIEEEAFTPSHSTLTVLHLDKNQLSEFPFEALNLFTSLTILTLNHNLFTVLPPFVSNSLQELSMNGNRNLVFEDGVFKQMYSISSISLEDIDLTDLRSNIFNGLKLKELRLGQNKLEALREHAINPAGTLQTLRLDSNQIQSIHGEAITGLSENAYLDFTRNDIVDIDSEQWKKTLDQITGKDVVELKGNPLKCGCDVYWIINDADQLDKITDHTECFDGTLLTILPLDFFVKHCQENQLV